jgi:soluble lytic murein transglycosylase-like protein
MKLKAGINSREATSGEYAYSQLDELRNPPENIITDMLFRHHTDAESNATVKENKDMAKPSKSKPESNVGFDSLVEKYATQFQVNPNWIRAMIKQESSGRVNALSKKGAQGLMQVMPKTAAEIARKLKVDKYDPSNPEQNIMFGTFYFAERLKSHKGDYKNATMAYNAGDKRIKAGMIPKESANYYEKIIKYYNEILNASA